MYRAKAIIAMLSILCLTTVFLSIAIGSTKIYRLSELLSMNIFRDPIIMLRIERTICGIITGLALSIAGLLLQVAVRNPLAEPYTFGMASSAFFALLIAIVLIGFPPYYLSILITFLGSITTLIFLLWLSRILGLSPLTVILVGISLSAFFSGISHTLAFIVYTKTGYAVYLMLAGTLSLAKLYPDILVYTIATMVLIFMAYSMWKPLNAVLYGDEYAFQLGYNPRRYRAIAIAIASILTALSVAIVGVVAFIGLIVPHIARIVLRSEDMKLLMPLSSLIGIVIVLLSDIVVRIISRYSILGELPLGIITSIIGSIALASLTIKRAREVIS